MGETIPIEMLKIQINTDYYRRRMSLEQVLEKYRRFDPEEVKKVLRLYDLDKEPDKGWSYKWFTPEIEREWNSVCRKLNPEAWK